MDAIGTQYTHETPMNRMWEFSSRLFANESFNWIWFLAVPLSATSLVNSSLSFNFAAPQSIIHIRKWLKQQNQLSLHPQIKRNCVKTHPEDCVFVAPFCAIRPHSAFARVQWHNSPRLQRGFVDMQTCQMSKMVSKNTIRDVGSTTLYTAYTVDTVYTIQNAKYWMGWTGLGGWIPQYTVMTTRVPTVLIRNVSVFNLSQKIDVTIHHVLR